MMKKSVVFVILFLFIILILNNVVLATTPIKGSVVPDTIQAQTANRKVNSAVIRGIINIVLVVTIYFVPTFVACKKKHPYKTPIILINVFLGWTFLGWVGALVWDFIIPNNK